MIRRFSRPAQAIGLSLCLAFSGLGLTATPARANDDVTAQGLALFIGSLAAIYAVGRALTEHQDRATPAPVPPRPRVSADPPRAEAPSRDRPRAGGHRPHRPLVAPQRCFIQGEDRNGRFRGYRLRCMQRTVAAPQRLPNLCLRRVETERGPRMIYGGRCLAQNGWVRG